MKRAFLRRDRVGRADCARSLNATGPNGDGVDHENYEPAYPFTGTVKRVSFDISGDAVKNAEAETRRAMSHQ